MDFHFLSKLVLFRGISAQEIEAMNERLHLFEKHYKKNDTIFCAGNSIRTLGLVLDGKVSIEHDDIWGNKSILDSVGPGQVFAETYASMPDMALMVSVVAASDCTILFMDMVYALSLNGPVPEYHGKLLRNLLLISSQKNFNLSRRIFHTSSKSIRARLLSYLSFQATSRGSYSFAIPFNRQQLADYLSVDRSALSKELGKMQKDKVLRVHKNNFTILDTKVLT